MKSTAKYLYRYSSAQHLERLKTVLLNHELYFPSLAELNDPADGRPKLKPMSEDELTAFLITGFVREHPELPLRVMEREAAVIDYNVRYHRPEVLLEIMSPFLNNLLEGYRILSLSKRSDNMVLWGTYAGGHTGYCLEFANEGSLFERAMEVNYGDFEVGLTDPELRKAYFFFCKTPAWSHEEEVRLVLQRGKGCKVKFQPRWLRRIILGKGMTENNAMLIRSWAKQRNPELTVANACFDQVRQTLLTNQ